MSSDASFSPTISETQTFIVTATNGSCSLQEAITVPVQALPTVDFTYSAACTGFSTVFTDNSLNVFSNPTYAWDFDGDGTNDLTSQTESVEFEFATAGTYEVTLTVLNQTGTCEAATLIEVIVSDDCDPCSEAVIAENIVPNPNIDNFSVCPDTLTQVEAADFWYSPTLGNADYFNACATNDTVAVPNNLFGSQVPLSGDGYFGMFTFGNNYREYVSTQLETALVAGENYCVSFNVSLADSIGRAADHIGVYFSNDSLNVGTQFPLNVTPQIENMAGNIITDATDWTNVSDVFVPNDSNDWITIGNFYDDFNTMSMAVPNDGPLNTQGFAYYYIDDITVSPIPQLNVNETQIVACAGDDISLNITDDAFCAYAWVNADNPTDTLSTETSFNFNFADATTTQFIVYADFGQCSVSQTIDVTINDFPDVQFEVLENCAGAATAFIDNSTNVLANATYAWDFENDGAINSTSADLAAYIYPTAGTYTAKLVITNAGGCMDSLLLEINVTEACAEDCTGADNLVTNAGFEQGVCPDELGQIDSTQTWTSLSGSEAAICSEFDNDCIEVTLLPIVANADGSNTYQYQLTNNCTQAFFYTSFEIVGGVFATDLNPSSVYNGEPSLGYSYDINYPFPNADIPFFGIQFETSTSDGPKNGDTETFAYTLPASESVPDEVQIVVQLSNSPVHHYVFSLATNSVNCNGQGESTTNFFTNGFPADWFSNCGGSQDETDVAIPNNAYGSQLPHGGDSYAGLIAYSTSGISQHQYLTSELSQPLVAGQTYCAKMFVSLAESSDFAIDQLGIYFSGNMPNTSVPLYQEPQVNNDATNYLFNQNGWLEVGTTFVADSAYQYITIGNFEAYPTNSLLVGTNTEGIAYYYIDDVSIVPVDLTVSEDATICEGENVDLEATTNLCDVYWINNNNPNEILSTTNNLSVSPDTTSTYVFVAKNGNCQLTDSVNIVVNALPNAEAGLDTFICVGSSIQLQATGGDTYEWSPTDFMIGENTATPTLTIDEIGLFTYFVTVTNAATGCQSTDSISVKTVALPTADAGNDTINICEDTFVNLGASGGVSYQWSPAAQLSDATIADPLATTEDMTTFYVTVTNDLGCQSVDSVVLIAQEAYDFVQMDTTICAGDSAVLDVPIPPTAVGFIWNPNNNLSANNIANPTTYATSNTLYTLTYEDELGCIGQVAVSLNINPIPNAGSDVQICANGSAQLNASAGGETYSWSPAGSLSQADIRNPIATPTETTTYTVTVTYADGLENCSQTDEVTVLVVPAGTADAGQDVTICAGESVELNAIGGDTYLWNADASLSQTDISNPIATPNETTTYTVTTTNQNTGCTATDEVTVIVNPADTPSVTTADNETIYCAVPFEPITICFNTEYAGCEDLINSVDNQLGSEITLSETCLTYEGAFVAAQSDTISFNACTADSNLCESLEIVIVACDQAPSWLDDVVEATACLNTATDIILPGAVDPDENDVLTYAVAETNNGTATIAAGQLIYTPNNNFIGLDTVLLTVCDSFYPTNDCDTLIVSVNAGFNSAPVANLTTATTAYETSSTICIIATDPEGHEVSFGSFGTITDGTAEITNENCISFTPNNGFSGVTNFTIEVCDECGECFDADVEVTVLPEPNTPPQVENIVVTTDFNTATTPCFNIIDADVDDTHTITYEGGASNATVTNLAVPCFTYTPLNDFVGTEVLTFEICDDEDCVTVTATITVLPPPNEAPIVVSDTTTTLYETPALICPEITDPEGQTVTITNVGTPTNGTVLLSSDTCFIYTPNDGFSGLDSFEITVCDNLNACTTETLYVEVLPKPNAAPDASDITIILPSNISTIDFCLNIVEPDGDPYTVEELTPAEHGTFTFINDTCINYTTGPTFEGNDEFEVIICDDLGACEEVTIYVVENFPPQVSDIIDTTAYNTPIVFCPEIVEPENQDVTINVIQVLNGIIEILNDSCVQYTPATFVGTQEMIFTACDAGQACDTFSIFITVLPLNETPVANDVTITTTENTPIDWCIPATDANGDDLNINIVTLPQNGNVTPQADTTCLSYTPNFSFLGEDSIQIAVCDPALACDTVWTFINVIETCENDTIYACTDINTVVDVCADYCLLSENAQIDFDNATSLFGTIATLGNTCLQYTPQNGFQGIDTLILPAFDTVSGALDTAVAVINIGCVAPVANNDISIVPSGTQVTIEVLDNDFSPCNDNVAVSIITPPFEGTAQNNNDNTAIIYNSPALFEGNDSLVYQACINCNGEILCSTATVYINNLLNLPPQVSDTLVTTPFNTSVEVCLDVTEPEGQAYASSVLVDANNGIITTFDNNPDCFIYTPNAGFEGTDTFEVQFCDGNNGCSTATVTVIVEDEPNEAPQVNDETITTPFETDADICLTIIDADHDISELTVSVLNNPLNGTIVVGADNCITYSPNADFSGNDQFVVQVCDPLGACDQATITVTVLENNNPPIVEPVADIIMSPNDTETVCLEISDLEGDITNVTIAGISPNEGTATLNGNCLTYEASSTQSGTYTITLEVCDDSDIVIACTTIDINFIVNSPPSVFNQTHTIDQNTILVDCLDITEPDGNDYFINIGNAPDDGTIDFIDDCFTYIPDPSFAGTDEITVQVCDEYNDCTLAVITIIVQDVFAAANDTVSVGNGGSTTITVLDNDTFPSESEITVNVVNEPSSGTLIDNGDGTFTYVADADFDGQVTFTYEICETDLGCETATVIVNVINGLQATDDIDITTFVDTPIDIAILDNDIYPDAGVDIVIINSGDVNGVVTEVGNTGVYTYLPDPSFVGTDTFMYVISATGFGSDTAIVIVTVLELPELPIALNDTAVVIAGNSVHIDVLANDTDPNTGNLTIVDIVETANNGLATIEINGTITYTPNTGFTGIDSFTYVVCNPDLGNGESICDTATVFVSVGTDAGCEVSVYSALSPNGDGLNDFLEATGLDCVENQVNEFVVFNRWGNVVFKTENYGTSDWWDGTFKESGNIVPDGTYFYVLTIVSQNIKLQGFIEVNK